MAGLWLKRYRCPDCGTVYTIRPISHFRGFAHSWFIVISSLLAKIKTNRWLKKGTSRQVQQYWWKCFLKQISKVENTERSWNALRVLLKNHVFPATSSLKYFEVKSILIPPYRIFAFTCAYEYG
jgi:hypothetical protein